MFVVVMCARMLQHFFFLPLGSLSARKIAFKTTVSLCALGSAGSSFGLGALLTSRSARSRASAPASAAPPHGASGSTEQGAGGAGGAGGTAGAGSGAATGQAAGEPGMARFMRSRMRRTCWTNKVDVLV